MLKNHFENAITALKNVFWLCIIFTLEKKRSEIKKWIDLHAGNPWLDGRVWDSYQPWTSSCFTFPLALISTYSTTTTTTPVLQYIPENTTNCISTTATMQ